MTDSEATNFRTQVREFLTSRRARVSPEQAGLPAWGGSNRRVPGLRREEAALLAGVSIDYYTRLERGNLAGASDEVLASMAEALQLDEAERAHLFDLARTAGASPRARATAGRRHATDLRPSVERVLASITDAPAYVRNARRDILGTNRLGEALYSEILADPVRPANIARFIFLNPRAHTFFTDWDRAAADSVANLRSEAGRNPRDRGISDLVGELCTRSDAFSQRWASHNVRFHRTGIKRLSHPVVGDLELTFEAMELPADPGLALVVYSAEPQSPTADALRLLASWAAIQDEEHIPPTENVSTPKHQS